MRRTIRMSDDAEPVVIRQCEICGRPRILKVEGDKESAVCGCGAQPLDKRDLEALADRGP